MSAAAVAPLTAQTAAIPDHPGQARLPAHRLHAARGQGLSGRPEERDGRLHRRGPDAAPREHRPHAAHRLLPRCPRARRAWPASPGRRSAAAARAPSPPSSSTRSWTSWPQRLHRDRRHLGARRPQLPARQPGRVAEGVRRDAEGAALPGGPPGPGQGAGAAGHEEAQRRLGGHRGAEWNVLLYGEEHFSNRFTTAASIQSITRDDLVAFHRKYVHPANMIAAVSGAFSRAEMIQKLEAAFAGWPGPSRRAPRARPRSPTAAPGLYRIQKDVNQGRVSIGLPTVRRDSPDIYALEVMNEILGGSGFTSRITKTVRSDEGLAYSAGSGLALRRLLPGRLPGRVPVQEPRRSPSARARAGGDQGCARRRSPPRSWTPSSAT